MLAPFHPRNQPWITRQSYLHELVTALTFPMALAMVEGGVVGVLAKKAFDVPPVLFATIMAAPMFANLTSFVWAFLARGRRKVISINVLQVLLLIVIASIALLPTSAAIGSLLLTAQIVIARCLISGIITIRSTVWRMNYPRHVRAQVTGRLALINTLIIAGAPLATYWLLDINADWFRILYPASVLVAMVGVVSFSRVRLRGEKDLLQFEKSPVARPQPHGEPAPIYEYDPEQSAGRSNFWTVLKQDRFYRSYMLWQFVAGVANMAGEVVLIYIIAEMTAGLSGEYLVSIVLTTAVPMALATATMPIWARYFDRVHVAEFRSKQAWFWVAGQASNWLGAALGSLPIIAVARVVQGLMRGGGMLAWNLGHNDFANRKMVAVYMGIHVTLTGIRGAIAPFVGMALYTGWANDALAHFGIASIPSFSGIGYHVFLITTGLAIAAELGYSSLARSIRSTQGDAVPAD